MITAAPCIVLLIPTDHWTDFKGSALARLGLMAPLLVATSIHVYARCPGYDGIDAANSTIPYKR